jgi:hypothetical protein
MTRKEKCALFFLSTGPGRFITPAKLVIPGGQLLCIIALRVSPVPERVNLHEMVIEVSGEFSIIDPDGFSLPVAFDQVRFFLRVGKQKVPLPPARGFLPASCVLSVRFAAVGTSHSLSIIPHDQRRFAVWSVTRCTA